jgi:formylglycine-generating enzyme required for sulfatase activity
MKNSIGMELVLIEPGEFLMGAPDSEANVEPYEKPQHRVRISQPFYIGKYEVTQAEYQQVMGTNPSYFASSGGGKSKVAKSDTRRFPVEQMSWNDAVDFCNKLSQRDGLTVCYDQNRQRVSDRGYRLPTEAEWEYACRAGITTTFHFGSLLNGDKANVNGQYPYGTTTRGTNLARTTAVDDPKYPLNAFGLAQMHGNVWEWCEDVYDEKVYAGRSGVTTNPVVTSGSTYRVLRGSSWDYGCWNSRSSLRWKDSPDLRFWSVGFRVVCSSGTRTQ